DHWSRAFVILTLMIAACGFLMVARQAPATNPVTAEVLNPTTTIATAAPNWSQRSLWILLALIPSGLMVAVTTYITTDIAAAPLLWVLPLALFLATFVLVFRERPFISYRWTNELVPVWVLGVIVLPTLLLGALAALLAFFAGAIVCHRELYLRRPAAEHLTEFYLLMSVGGALGGIITALIAPHVFASTSEFILLLIAAMACRPGVVLGRSESLDPKRVTGVVGVSMGILLAYKAALSFNIIAADSLVLFPVILLVFLCLIQIRKLPEHRLALVLVMLIAALIQPRINTILFVERSFFGTHRVTETADGSVRMLLHGTTIHGAQRIKDTNGLPVEEPLPQTYYHSNSPISRSIAAARRHMAERRPGHTFRVGVAGLGAGALACQSAPGDLWRFYEIDPAVVRIARDPTLFTFLSHCHDGVDIVLGDARLSLVKEPSGGFGMLLMDAFTSDSIPIHLLTVEAIQLYFDKLDNHGILALHFSNRHLDLAPSLFSTVMSIPGVSAVAVFDKQPEGNFDAVSSNVLFVAREPEALAPILDWPGAMPVTHTTARAWTDDYSDILSALLRRLTKD
ncbi:MAG: fused MFS/spermidine synthase, partial [Gammaproteobacteria bacterium]